MTPSVAQSNSSRMAQTRQRSPLRARAMPLALTLLWLVWLLRFFFLFRCVAGVFGGGGAARLARAPRRGGGGGGGVRFSPPRALKRGPPARGGAGRDGGPSP